MISQEKSKGLKNDEGKPDYTLLAPCFLEGVIKVLEHGVQTYGFENWKKGIEERRLLSAIARHLFAIIGGEDIDQNSGIAHIYHIGANVQFLSWYREAFFDKTYCGFGTKERYQQYKEKILSKETVEAELVNEDDSGITDRRSEEIQDIIRKRKEG